MDEDNIGSLDEIVEGISTGKYVTRTLKSEIYELEKYFELNKVMSRIKL